VTQRARWVCDVAVVGGGPGGLAAGLAAARAGLDVVVFEPQRAPIDKPCGEGLMPSGVDALRQLGLDSALERGHVFSRLRYCVDGLEPFELDLSSAGLSLDRLVLARELRAALEREPRARIVPEHVEFERDGSYRAKTSQGELEARTLIAADGLHGRTAAWLREPVDRDTGHQRLGIRARCASAMPLDAVEIHLGAHGDVYLTPLAGDRTNVAVLLDIGPDDRGGAAALLERTLARTPAARARLGTLVTEPEARRLGGARPRCLARDGAFLVGDAGGGIDPVLGCGTSVALSSGITAARAAARVVCGASDGSAERDYARDYRAQVRVRRGLATWLLAMGRHPRLARGTFRVARAAPRLTGLLVSIAAGTR